MAFRDPTGPGHAVSQEAALGRLRQQPPRTPIEMRATPPEHFSGKPYLKWQDNSPISGKQEIHRVVTCPGTQGIRLLLGCVPHSGLNRSYLPERTPHPTKQAVLIMSGRL